MMEPNLIKWAQEAYKTEEWLQQPQRKRDCTYNICIWGQQGGLCEIDDDKCKECKAFNYMPMGLEGMVEGGFVGISRMQNKGGNI